MTRSTPGRRPRPLLPPSVSPTFVYSVDEQPGCPHAGGYIVTADPCVPFRDTQQARSAWDWVTTRTSAKGRGESTACLRYPSRLQHCSRSTRGRGLILPSSSSSTGSTKSDPVRSSPLLYQIKALADLPLPQTARTAILKNPKLRTPLTASLPPGSTPTGSSLAPDVASMPKEGTAAAILAANEAKRAARAAREKEREERGRSMSSSGSSRSRSSSSGSRSGSSRSGSSRSRSGSRDSRSRSRSGSPRREDKGKGKARASRSRSYSRSVSRSPSRSRSRSRSPPRGEKRRRSPSRSRSYSRSRSPEEERDRKGKGRAVERD